MKELLSRIVGFWHSDEYAAEMFKAVPKQWYRLFTSNQLLFCLRYYYETGDASLIKGVHTYVTDRYEWNAAKGYWLM